LYALKRAWKAFSNLVPPLLGVMGLVGIMLAVMEPERISTLRGEQSGWIGTVLAAIVGSITPIPGFIAFPTAAMLLERGAGYLRIAVFVSTLMSVGVVTLPVEISYFLEKNNLREKCSGICAVADRRPQSQCHGCAPIKKYIRQYKFAIVVLIAPAAVFWHDAELGGTATAVAPSAEAIKQLLLVLPPIFILLGVRVPMQKLSAFLGEDAGFPGLGGVSEKGSKSVSHIHLHRSMVDDKDSHAAV
jgi:hypothetical protein